MASIKTLVFSPLDTYFLIRALKKRNRLVNSRQALKDLISERYAEIGWTLTHYSLGKDPRRDAFSVTLEGSPLNNRKHDWMDVLGVEPQLIGYRILPPGMAPRKNAAQLSATWLLAIAAGLVLILAAGTWVLFTHSHHAEVASLPLHHTNLKAAENAQPAAAAAASTAQTAAPASANEPAAAGQAQAPGYAYTTPPQSLEPQAAPEKEETYTRPSQFREPHREVLKNVTGPQPSRWVAGKALELLKLRKDAPVLYLTYQYKLDAQGANATSESWWFNFRDDYILNVAVDFASGKAQATHRRLLAGEVFNRLKTMRDGNIEEFRLTESDRWLTGNEVAPFAFVKYLEVLHRQAGPQLVAKAEMGKTTNELLLTVTPAWSELPYDERLAKTQAIWNEWRITRFPTDPDQVFVKLLDSKGEKAGGSTLLGAAISVPK